ncbi:MAG: prepilin-type N-terminal cleavage/methylation domain-containing protein [Aquificae bacterium]|nr:prepilin-type N-terminal cleavage/methylation domain-containing protein [Aquificota bacterium]
MRDLYQAFAEAKRLNKKRGFTLIELLVVIAIIAILAAIAIPQFAKYRVRAFNSAAESDIRNIRTTMEAVYADFMTYSNADDTEISATAPAALDLSDLNLPGLSENVSLSSGVTAGIHADRAEFTAAAAHRDGDRAFCVDSDDSALWWDTKDRGTAIAIGDVPDSDGTAGDNECSTDYPNRL